MRSARKGGAHQGLGNGGFGVAIFVVREVILVGTVRIGFREGVTVAVPITAAFVKELGPFRHGCQQLAAAAAGLWIIGSTLFRSCGLLLLQQQQVRRGRSSRHCDFATAGGINPCW